MSYLAAVSTGAGLGELLVGLRTDGGRRAVPDHANDGSRSAGSVDTADVLGGCPEAVLKKEPGELEQIIGALTGTQDGEVQAVLQSKLAKRCWPRFATSSR